VTEIPDSAIAVAADISYDDCLLLCHELGLIEMIKHGEHDYGRITQKGHNVLNALLRMAMNSADPANVLRKT
jgi:hypothetical protein